MRVGGLSSVAGFRWAFLKMQLQIRILRYVELTPRGWLYLGCLGGDRLPFGASTLRPEGDVVLFPPELVCHVRQSTNRISR